jgi:lycopene beta-cyclase
MINTPSCDVAIAGGGLAGCLIALALAERRPDLDVRIVEAGERLGGEHIWSFFDDDVAPDHRWLVDPLICQSWDGYDVHFPAHSRSLPGVYNSILSARLDKWVREVMPAERIIHGMVATLDHAHIRLEDGSSIVAPLIIDARGPGSMAALDLGWQKFMGQLLRVQGGHGLSRPIVMDAKVAQIDGYRFVYCLPFDEDHVFVEDTYYSDTPTLNPEALRGRITEYASRRGWVVSDIGHEETGCLPVAMGGHFDRFWATGGQGARAGLRAGLFHPLTGYALPDAVRTAIAISDAPLLETAPVSTLTKTQARAAWADRRFYRWLTRMMFRAAEPPVRYRILEQFYTRDEELIARFYAARSTLADKMRILSGKPPVPITRAIKALAGR